MAILILLSNLRTAMLGYFLEVVTLLSQGNFTTVHSLWERIQSVLFRQVPDDEGEAVSTSTASTGNQFRYDRAENQYVFNLITQKLSVGTWRGRIELDDGISYDATFSLK